MNRKVAIAIIILKLLVIIVLIFIFANYRNEINHLQTEVNTLYNYKLNEPFLKEKIAELKTKNSQLQSQLDELNISFAALLLAEDNIASNFFATENWPVYTVTGYSLNDPAQGTSTIGAIGIDLSQDWTKYFKFCAVDPEVIPLGSLVVVKHNNFMVEYYLAVDTGGLIKGHRIDLLFSTKDEALSFGIQALPIQVIIN